MIDESLWALLEATPPTVAGLAMQRLFPDSEQDLFAAVQHPQMYRMLVYEVPAEQAPTVAEVPRLRHIHAQMHAVSDEAMGIFLRLEAEPLTDVFTAFANDVSTAVSLASTSEEGVSAFLGRMDHWRRLLQTEGNAGLTREERRGLFGELFVFQRLLEMGTPMPKLLSAWVGPGGAHQDFQFPTVAVEVKTSAAKQPQTLVITSERQLDSTGIDHLYLLHVSVDERAAGIGQTLSDIVAAVESHMNGQQIMAFRNVTYPAGLLPDLQERYPEPSYTVRSVDVFAVRDGFPRITEQQCPPGLGNVRYHLQLGAVSAFTEDLESAVHQIEVSE